MTGWSQGNPRGLPEDHRDLPAPAVLQQQGPSSRLGRGQMKVGDGLRVPPGLNAPRSPRRNIPWVPRGSLQEVQQEGAAPRALPPVLSPSLSPSLAVPGTPLLPEGPVGCRVHSGERLAPIDLGDEDSALRARRQRHRRVRPGGPPCGARDSGVSSSSAHRQGATEAGTAVAPTQQGGRGTWICPRTAPCEPREEADAQCPTSRPAS